MCTRMRVEAIKISPVIFFAVAWIPTSQQAAKKFYKILSYICPPVLPQYYNKTCILEIKAFTDAIFFPTQESCARTLLFRGADRSALNFAGQTPYQVAVIAGNLELAEVIQGHRAEDVGESPKSVADMT